MLFDRGGTAKSRSIAHVRVHRRPVHKPLAFGVSQVYRLVNFLYVYFLSVVELVELRGLYPQNERTFSRSHVTFFIPHPTSHPAGGVQDLQKA
jgi:hypothetical protein